MWKQITESKFIWYINILLGKLVNQQVGIKDDDYEIFI